MFRVGFKPTMPMFELAKTFNALECATTVIGLRWFSRYKIKICMSTQFNRPLVQNYRSFPVPQKVIYCYGLSESGLFSCCCCCYYCYTRIIIIIVIINLLIITVYSEMTRELYCAIFSQNYIFLNFMKSLLNVGILKFLLKIANTLNFK